MGDININMLGGSKISKEYLNLIRSQGFNPHIFEATHITETSQTFIDPIFLYASLLMTLHSLHVGKILIV